MKFARVALFAVIASASVVAPYSSRAFAAGTAFTEESSAKPFLGRWDLTLKDQSHEYPSWLEVTEDGNQLKARFVGRWGHARPLPSVTVSDGKLTFVSPKDEEGSNADLVFEGHLSGKTLAGTLNGPDGTTWQWTGVRAPVLGEKKTPHWGEPILLFNGTDLSGWKQSKPGPPDWTVKDGAIIKPGNAPELISERKFKDFKLHLEFNCGKDANSGVYLRGRYEVQVETESQAEPPSHHTGGVYGYLDPTPEQPRTPDVWQTYDITLIGRHVTIVLNGKTVIDNQEIPGLTGGALDSHEAEPGPIYLQGSEKGQAAFRNIVVTPAK